MKGSKLVADAISGRDFQTIVVNGKAYAVHPPTIAKIASATSYLTQIQGGETINDILSSLQNIECASMALSCFIQGDGSLSEELAQGEFGEVVEALEIALSMISAENFIKLSVLVRNVQRLIAKPK